MNEFENNNVIRDVSTNNSFLVKVFAWMFMGLFATGLVSFFTYATGFINVICTPRAVGILLILEILVVISFGGIFQKKSPFVVSILFFVYAIINGLSISSIYVTYELSSLILIFFGVAAYFGILCLIGYTTKKDLSNLGVILSIALSIALIISIVNIFIGATIVDLVLDWVIIAIFTGITICNMQEIKRYEQIMPESGYIHAAMTLYLEFINLFLRLLSVFGKRKD